MALRLDSEADSSTNLLFLGWNQDAGCLAIGHSGGLKIMNTSPFKETFSRDFPSGGLGYVEMLFRCNILALVGGGRYPCFLPGKVVLWDDHQATCIGDLSFKDDVKAVKLRRDIVVVALANQVYVYNFERLDLINKYDTYDNPRGLIALSPGSNCVLACPAIQPGLVRVEHISQARAPTFITAHESALAYIALTLDGTRLATASEKGTLIRIFDTVSGDKLQEVRRGRESAHIYCIAFSRDARHFCCTSNKGTLHLFASNEATATVSEVEGSSSSAAAPAASSGNTRSRLAIFGGLNSYFSSEWSFAQFKVPELPTICAFGPDPDTIMLASSDGVFRRIHFNSAGGGECEEIETAHFYGEDE